MLKTLDRYERHILKLLQADAALSTAAIAERVGLSPSPCWRRIDRLERDGFIKRRVAIVDPCHRHRGPRRGRDVDGGGRICVGELAG